ncbi:hypothetical protein D3C78_915910 [compost metagenome]
MGAIDAAVNAAIDIGKYQVKVPVPADLGEPYLSRVLETHGGDCFARALMDINAATGARTVRLFIDYDQLEEEAGPYPTAEDLGPDLAAFAAALGDGSLADGIRICIDETLQRLAAEHEKPADD